MSKWPDLVLPPRCRWTGDSSIDTSTPVLTEDEAIEALKMCQTYENTPSLSTSRFCVIQVGFQSKKMGFFPFLDHWLPTPFHEGNKQKSQMNEAFEGYCNHLEAAALTDEVAFKPKGSSSSSFFFEERIEEIRDETC